MRFFINRNGQNEGPFDLEQLQQMDLPPNTACAGESEAQWRPLSEVLTESNRGAGYSRIEGMAVMALGVGVLALLLGGVTHWAGAWLMIITIVLGVVGLALGIIGMVRIKNGMGDRRGMALAVTGSVIAPLAILLAVVVMPSAETKKENKRNGESASERGPRTASSRDRARCVSNVSQITKAMIGFSLDNNDRLPWHLTPRGMQNHFGEADAMNLGNIFASSALKAELQTPKILLSPCDPERKAANAEASEQWQGFSAREGRPVPLDAISYGLCEGADIQKPSTILVITRNVSGEDLQGAKFLGDVMSLTANQGQFSQADGSAHQSNDDRLAETVMAHTNERGGLLPSPASTRLILPNK